MIACIIIKYMASYMEKSPSLYKPVKPPPALMPVNIYCTDWSATVKEHCRGILMIYLFYKHELYKACRLLHNSYSWKDSIKIKTFRNLENVVLAMIQWSPLEMTFVIMSEQTGISIFSGCLNFIMGWCTCRICTSGAAYTPLLHVLG